MKRKRKIEKPSNESKELKGKNSGNKKPKIFDVVKEEGQAFDRAQQKKPEISDREQRLRNRNEKRQQEDIEIEVKQKQDKGKRKFNYDEGEIVGDENERKKKLKEDIGIEEKQEQDKGKRKRDYENEKEQAERLKEDIGLIKNLNVALEMYDRLKSQIDFIRSEEGETKSEIAPFLAIIKEHKSELEAAWEKFAELDIMSQSYKLSPHKWRKIMNGEIDEPATDLLEVLQKCSDEVNEHSSDYIKDYRDSLEKLRSKVDLYLRVLSSGNKDKPNWLIKSWPERRKGLRTLWGDLKLDLELTLSNKKNSTTMTPQYWIREPLPQDRKKADTFFDRLSRPRIDSDESKNPLIVMVTHLFGAHIPYIEAVKKRGQLGMVIGKGQSRDDDIILMLRKQYNFPVQNFGREVTENPEEIVPKLKELLKPGQPIVILDHGAYFKEIDKIQALLGEEHRVLGICEATRNGVVEYLKKEQTQSLSIPVISLDNELKDRIERMIGSSIALGARTILKPFNVNIDDKDPLVIGYGPVGCAIAEQLTLRKPKVLDIDGIAQVNAQVGGYTIVQVGTQIEGKIIVTADEQKKRIKALEKAEIIFCASGSKALKTEDYIHLKDGCYIALATSQDSEIEPPPQCYTCTKVLDNIYEYANKPNANKPPIHKFYFLGPRPNDAKEHFGAGAVNFANLEPGVGDAIYAVQGMELETLSAICEGNLKENVEGEENVEDLMHFIDLVKDVPKRRRNNAESRWVIDLSNKRLNEVSKHWTDCIKNAQSSLEILRQRHVRKEITTEIYQEMQKELEDSINSEKKYVESPLWIDISTLETVRQDYARGKIKDSQTFQEMREELEYSIICEKESARRTPSVDVSMLKILRKRLVQGKVNIETTQKTLDVLDNSIEYEEEVATCAPFVDISSLKILRERLAQGDEYITPETFQEIRDDLQESIEYEVECVRDAPWMDISSLKILREQYARGDITPATFDEVHDALHDSIEYEIAYARTAPWVDVSSLKILREQYAGGKITPETFWKIHQKLEDSLLCEREYATNAPQVDVSVLKILRKRLVRGIITPETFQEIHDGLKASIDLEKKFADRNLGVPRALPYMQQDYAQGKIGHEAFKTYYLDLYKSWLHASGDPLSLGSNKMPELGQSPPPS